jgi:integrase
MMRGDINTPVADDPAPWSECRSAQQRAYESRVNDEFVFPGRSLVKPISNKTMLKHLKQITGHETLTVHGFRTTFRTWAREETDFEEEIVDCLHHITGDDAEKAYKHGEALRCGVLKENDGRCGPGLP